MHLHKFLFAGLAHRFYIAVHYKVQLCIDGQFSEIWSEIMLNITTVLWYLILLCYIHWNGNIFYRSERQPVVLSQLFTYDA